MAVPSPLPAQGRSQGCRKAKPPRGDVSCEGSKEAGSDPKEHLEGFGMFSHSLAVLQPRSPAHPRNVRLAGM